MIAYAQRKRNRQQFRKSKIEDKIMDMMNRIKRLRRKSWYIGSLLMDADVQVAADFIGDSFYL